VSEATQACGSARRRCVAGARRGARGATPSGAAGASCSAADTRTCLGGAGEAGQTGHERLLHGLGAARPTPTRAGGARRSRLLSEQQSRVFFSVPKVARYTDVQSRCSVSFSSTFTQHPYLNFCLLFGSTHAHESQIQAYSDILFKSSLSGRIICPHCNKKQRGLFIKKLLVPTHFFWLLSNL
jgi:hypothetical protein